MPVSGAKMAPSHKATGAHPKLKIEWVTDEAVFHSQTWQEMRLRTRWFAFAWRANTHA
jgi:hypothetical protein